MEPYITEMDILIKDIHTFIGIVRDMKIKERNPIIARLQLVLKSISSKCLSGEDHFTLCNDDWDNISEIRAALVKANQPKLAVRLAVLVQPYK